MSLSFTGDDTIVFTKLFTFGFQSYVDYFQIDVYHGEIKCQFSNDSYSTYIHRLNNVVYCRTYVKNWFTNQLNSLTNEMRE